MEGREIHGFVTGLHSVPTIPKASFGSGNTSLMSFIGVDIEDWQNSTKMVAAVEQPALFIFTGDSETVPIPSGQPDDLFEQTYLASTPGGGMTKKLFAYFMEHVYLPDLKKQIPGLQKGIHTVLNVCCTMHVICVQMSEKP